MPKADKPNILVIWGDDIGQSNLSCYTHGLMGYHTPNIDRIAKEGMLFTDSYGEQSCTAGRSSFITGQSVYRTGLSKVGIPAAPIGMNEKIVTIAALLKEQGYATGQFGKNHLGDLNHMLPTNHGFDEFFGNLYHLNAEEEPEMEDYPTEQDIPGFKARFAPRGVMRSWATDKDNTTEMPRWGKVGKQKIEDTGPLTRKRMETCDDDFVVAAIDFIKRMNKEGKPWFVWLNTTHMHWITHSKAKSKGQAGRWQSGYHDTMIDHDKNVGQMLDLLDVLGIAESRTYKNHIDGYNLLPYLSGEVKESPRNFFFYFSDDGDILAMRYDNWKIVFLEQRMEGTMGVWLEPFVRLRGPKIYNLRTDPYEYATITSNTYWDWQMHHVPLIYFAQAAAAKFAETFKEFPAIQPPNTFTIDDAMAKMSEAASGANH